MSAAVSIDTDVGQVISNVIPVSFGETPVVTDFSVASKPRGEIAMRLAAEAAEMLGKLPNADKKAGVLRNLSTGRGDLLMINPYLVKIKEGHNSRIPDSTENLAHIDWLARSIAEIGVQQPLTVALEGSDVWVTDGHCRLLATFRAIEVYGAEIKAIPLRAETRFSTPADHVLRQLLTGKGLSPLEQGNAFVKLLGLGWNTAQIAAKSGIGEQRINQILDLYEVTNNVPALREMVTGGSVASSTVEATLARTGGDTDETVRLLSEAVEVAKAAGKTRATAKHVRTVTDGEAADTEAVVRRVAKPAAKKTITSIFQADSTIVNNSDEGVTIVMTQAHWFELAKLLNL